MTEKTDQKQGKHLFKPGQSGNPNGRPKGARNKFSQDFIEALAKDFESNGADAIQQVRQEKPEQYLNVIAKMLPKEINLNVSESQDDWVGELERVESEADASRQLLDLRTPRTENPH